MTRWTVILGGSNAQLLANVLGNLLQPNLLAPFRAPPGLSRPALRLPAQRRR